MKKFKLLSSVIALPLVLSNTLPLVASCGIIKSTKCTVTFKAEGKGKLLGFDSITVEKGTQWKDVEKPKAIPYTTGIFDAWYTQDGNKITDTTQIDADTTVTAKFNVKCIVSLSSTAGGSIRGKTSLDVKQGTLWKDIKNQFEAVADEWYDFKGWFNNDALMNDDDPITTNIGVVAKFEIQKFNVSFQASEGGTISGPTTMTVSANTKWKDVKNAITVTPNAYHQFLGWFDSKQEELKDDTLVQSNIVATAKFEIQKFNVSFQASDGGTISSSTTITVPANTKWKDIRSTITVTPNDNYQFLGWFNSDHELTDDSLVQSNIVATAKFSAITLTKTVDANIYAATTANTYTYFGTLGDSYKICHFNDSSIGYISVESYFNTRYPQFFDVSTNNFVTTITNKLVPSSVIKKVGDNTCVIDYINQTITFQDWEIFSDFTGNNYGPMTSVCSGGENYYYSVTSKEYVKNSSKVIDLKKYHINVICYKNTNGVVNGFIPYEFYRNVFNLYAYGGVALDYNGAGLYQAVSGCIAGNVEKNILPLKAAAKAAAPENFYNSAYMEYLYNLLALTIDTRYGMTQRVSRVDGKIIKYLEKDIYDILKPYHDDLVSTDNDVSSAALKKIFVNYLDDGGHTVYSNLDCFSTKGVDTRDVLGNEAYRTLVIKSYLAAARKDANHDVTSGIGYYKKYDNAEKGNIAYLTFDSFAASDSNTWTDAEKSAGRELPSGTTDDNCGNDTLRLTMYANEKVRSDSDNIKSLVVDLSNNGGGSAYTAFFIASWLCGGITQKLWNPKTNSYTEFEIKADINGDKKFDENDYLPSTVDLYIITSSSSFSCGNLLPCSVQDNRTVNMPGSKNIYIGTKSGGGCCSVDGNLHVGANSFYQFSSSKCLLRNESTSTNFITNDSGCSITQGWEIDDKTATGRAAFYDRAAINNRIWAL